MQLRIILISIISVLALSSCKDDLVDKIKPLNEISTQDNDINAATNVAFLTADEIPHVVKKLRRLASSINTRSAGSYLSLDSIHYDRILVASNDSGSVRSYSMLVGDTMQHSFFNLVMEEYTGSDDSELTPPFVLEYSFSESYKASLQAGTVERFDGTIKKYMFHQAFGGDTVRTPIPAECWEIVFPEGRPGGGSGSLGTLTFSSDYWWGPSRPISVPPGSIPTGGGTGGGGAGGGGSSGGANVPCYITWYAGDEIIAVVLDANCNGIEDIFEFGENDLPIETKNPSFDECRRLMILCGIIPGIDILPPPPPPPGPTIYLIDVILDNLIDLIHLTQDETVCLQSSDNGKQTILTLGSLTHGYVNNSCINYVASLVVDKFCATYGTEEPASILAQSVAEYIQQQCGLQLLDGQISWLENNPDKAEAIIQMLCDEGTSQFTCGSVEVYITFDQAGYFDYTDAQIESNAATINSITTSILNGHGLTAQNQLNGTTWLRMFQKDEEIGQFNIWEGPRRRLMSVLYSLREGWSLIDAFANGFETFVIETIGDLPQTNEEWYVLGATLGPMLIELGADIGTDFIPIVGEIKGFANTFTAMEEGDFTTAGIEFFGTLLGILPVGDIAKGAGKSIKKLENAITATKVFRTVKRVGANVFSKIKNLVESGWNVKWNDNIITFKNTSDVQTGRFTVRTENVVDNLDNYDADVDIPTRHVDHLDGWKLIDRADIDHAPSSFPTQSTKTYIGKGNIAENANRIKVIEGTPLKNQIDNIVANGDPTGSLTESLSHDFYKDVYGVTPRSDLHLTAPPNTGFDNVIFLEDGGVIINEAKQMSSAGTVSLNASNQATGLPSQMSDDWIEDVIGRMVEEGGDLETQANTILTAYNSGNLKKVVTAVDKNTGEIVIVKLANFATGI